MRIVPDTELSDSDDEGGRRNERSYHSNGLGDSSLRKSRNDKKKPAIRSERAHKSSKSNKPRGVIMEEVLNNLPRMPMSSERQTLISSPRGGSGVSSPMSTNMPTPALVVTKPMDIDDVRVLTKREPDTDGDIMMD